MKKLTKFFSKLSTDKFPPDSEGRRLNEPERDKTLKRSQLESPLPTPRGPPSQEAMRAADAALNRMAAKEIPKSNFDYINDNIFTETAIQRKVEAENAQIRKQVLAAEQIAAQFSKGSVVSDAGSDLKSESSL